MKNIISLLLILSFTMIRLSANNTVSDSIYQKWVDVGVQRVNQVMAKNEEFSSKNQFDSLNFIINIDYTEENNFDTLNFYNETSVKKDNRLFSVEREREINDYFRSIYRRTGIYCYFFISHTHEYSFSLKFPEELKIRSIIDYYNKKEEIEKAMKARDVSVENVYNDHGTLSKDIESRISKDKKYCFLSLGVYMNNYYTSYFYNYYFNKIEDLSFKLHLSSLMQIYFNGSLKDHIPKKEFIENMSLTYANLIQEALTMTQIITTNDKSALCNLLDTDVFPLNKHDDYISPSYKALTLEERVHCLKVLSMGWFVNGYIPGGCDAEGKIVALIRNTPAQDVKNFLVKLREAKNCGEGSERTNSLIYHLIRVTDDGVMGIGRYNYSHMIRAFNSIFKAEAATGENSHFYTSLKEISENPIIMKDCIANYGVNYDNLSIGTIKLDGASIRETGVIEVQRSILTDLKSVDQYSCDGMGYCEVIGTETVGVWGASDEVILQPFDLVMFTNNSDLSILNEGSGGQKGETMYLPAVFLPYVYHKRNQKIAEDVVIYTLDAVTLVSGTGALFKASNMAYRAWIVTDMLNSAGNIMVNGTNLLDGHPDLKNAYNVFTMAFGGVSLAVMGTRGIQKFSDCLPNGRTVGNAYSAAKDFIQKADEYCKLAYADARIVDALQKQMLKMRQYWKYIADVPMPTLTRVASTVPNMSKGAQKMYAYSIFTKATSVVDGATQVSLSYANNVVAYLKKMGTTATNKLSLVFRNPLSDVMPDGATVMYILDGIEYYAKDATNVERFFENASVIIAKMPDGTIQCIKGACFAAGTPIKTKTGIKPIEQIQANDEVLSYDERTQTNVFSRVVNTSVKQAQRLIRLVFGKDTIFATPEHPFYAVEKQADNTEQGTWVYAGSLKKGLKILLASGLLANVESTFAFDTTATVYNFEVENTHTYYVGTEGVLAHNAYSPATVQSILATLTVANAGKWTGFLDKIAGMGVTMTQRAKLYDEISKITNQGDLLEFLNKFDAIEVFRRGIINDIDLVNSWRSCKLTNIDILKVIKKYSANLTSTELNRLNQIFGGGDELSDLVKAFDNANDVGGLKNLLDNTKWTDDFILTLRRRLVRDGDYPNFASDLAQSFTTATGQQRILDIAENMMRNPANAKTIWNNFLQNNPISSASLNRLASSLKFRFFMGAGNDWGTLVSANLNNIPVFRIFINAGDIVLFQTHLKSATGKIIIADDLLLHPMLDGLGRRFYRGVLNDSKLSAGSPWTDNQFSELINCFRNDPNLVFLEFEIRTAGTYQGSKVLIHRQDIYKTIKNSSGSFEPINMNSINFTD